jgi:serine/threonine protein phosphatase 1
MVSWLGFGGVATLRSYGIETGLASSRQHLEAIRAKLEEKLPHSHREFYENCMLCHTEGNYYFVHAGIRPGVALEKQNFEDQLWIREAFTASQANHGAIIVHGHTISAEPELLPNRMGIDTGAFATGILTALVLEGNTQRLLQTGKSTA